MKKGGWLMKKGYILWLLISVISLPVVAQNIIYSNLKELMAQDVASREAFQKPDSIDRRG